MAAVIETHGLTRRYGDLTAVDGISLSIGEGELYGLLGPNGSGKTTSIKMLTGQLQPTSGTASVAGVDPARHPLQVKQAVGIIPEQETPPSFLTAEEYLQFVAAIRDINDAAGRIDTWFARLDFAGQRDILCKDLSRGTRQKLMFAQAFLHRPGIAFVDEPLINLDPVIQRTVKDYMLDYVARDGTIFLCTHVLDIAEEICTRVGIIHHGSILSDLSMDEATAGGQRLETVFLEAVGGA
ncbi:MAG: ABC transporter ATP-binding protein [Candidatus Thermoplasmatota archaeon]|nr:ABC transporter ATP-binding protein [Candidatus Thermoplasmatota archaeon]